MVRFQAARAWQLFWLPRLEQVQCARRLEEHARFLDRPLEEGDDAWSDYSARIDALIALALLETAHRS